jgi:sugar phosphate isomerase/epimerase
MVDQYETHEIMSRGHRNLGLLIDVAHLKVSANTLKFSPVAYLENFHDLVSAYHFSDNFGFEDSNDEITEDAWFWPYINKGLDYYSLEVYGITEKQQRQQLDLLADFLYS